jgi:hypothetical protein
MQPEITWARSYPGTCFSLILYWNKNFPFLQGTPSISKILSPASSNELAGDNIFEMEGVLFVPVKVSYQKQFSVLFGYDSENFIFATLRS